MTATWEQVEKRGKGRRGKVKRLLPLRKSAKLSFHVRGLTPRDLADAVVTIQKGIDTLNAEG